MNLKNTIINLIMEKNGSKFAIFLQKIKSMKTLKVIILAIILLQAYNVDAQKYDVEYDKTIDKLIPKAKRNKLNEKQIILLTNSYHEANQNDHQRIIDLKKSGQPDVWIEVFHRVNNINNRQNKIKTLPENIKVAMNFKLLDLDSEIKNSKNKSELYICAKANLLFKNPSEDNLNELSKLIDQLSKINPQSTNIDDLKLKMIIMPSRQILFRVAAPTELYLPDNFAQLALDFDDNTIYNVPFDIVPNENVKYDLMIRIMIEEKIVSPEHINSVTFEEKNGDKIAKVTDITMSKTAGIIGRIEFIDIEHDAILLNTPFDIASTFVHRYAEFSGDKEACSSQTLELINQQHIDFPSNDALFKDVARKLNSILKTHYQKK